MKKLLLILLCVPLIGFSQIFTEPTTLNLIDEYDPNWSPGNNLPIFGPIGWSKDGIFAYQMTYCAGPCLDCCGNYISVESAKTDKQIDVIDLNSEENGSIESSWNQNQKEIDSLLLKYNIRNTGFGEFYRSNKLENFEIILKQRSNNRCDDPVFGTSINYQVLLGNNKVGYKRVTSGEIECLYTGLNFEGYFISPFEDRILIVLSAATQGYEGEKDYDLYFYGCSLNPSTFK